jgi:hypothetical protein
MATNQGIDLFGMAEVINAAREKHRKNFRETQRIRSYVLQKKVFAHAESETPEHKFKWTMRIKSAQNSTGAIDPFEQPEAVRDTYDTTLEVRPCRVITHKNMVFDDLAKMINEGSSEQLWRDAEMKLSSAEEEKAEMWESKLLNPPQTDGGKDGTLGALYHLRRSMDSNGAFVAQTTPARNGVRYVDGSGSLSSVMYGKDISLAQYSRLRTLVATHSGVMDEQLLITIRDCIRESRFEYIDKLKGDKSTHDLMILWDPTFQSQYDDLCKSLGGPLKRDFFEVGETTIKGVPTMEVPFMANHFLRPILGWNFAQLKYRKLKGLWAKQYAQERSLTSHWFPEISAGQMWGEDPSTNGFLVHGEFETGQ